MSMREKSKRRREYRCPLGLLRSCRKLAGLAGREIEQTEFKDCRRDALERVESVEPGWTHEDEDGGWTLSKLTPAECFGEDQRPLVYRVREIRTCLHRMLTPAALHSGVEGFAAILEGLESVLRDSRVPLAPQERRIWDLLLKQPEDRPLTSKQIVARLRKDGSRVSGENARRSLATTLKAKGVQNRRNAGYFIPREFRPTPGGD